MAWRDHAGGARQPPALDHPELDERDRLARDRAFRLAYPLLLAVLVISLGVLARARRRVHPRAHPGWAFFALLPLIGVLALLGWLARRPH